LANGKSMFADSFVTKDTTLSKYQVYNDEVYERHIVHKFRLGDCEDPDIYVAEPIYKWQQTEHGQWVMKHGRDQQYHMHMDYASFGYQVAITAHISAKRWTEYCLRFPVIT
jgi:hypothetical protein